jgi:glycosyltransferase involved in cell wall biosynthesis
VRIVFYDPNHANYHAGSVFERPLGGTQSAACCLAIELVRLGHEVIYLTGTSIPQVSHGVACPGRAYLRPAALSQFDADVFITLQRAGLGGKLRALLPARTRLLFWNADTPQQPVVAALKDPAECAAYDTVVTVSDWQRTQFAAAFPHLAEKLITLRYGMSPAFQNLFPPATPIMPEKSWPPILAYTSTPFRGLNVLLHIFPEIRRRLPGTRLQVFSGMQVYFIDPLADTPDIRSLYDRARSTEGVDYIGNLPQPRLAQRLKTVSMLLYPNTYEETACISVMEAFAAGCSVLTSDYGALPETAAGRARLIDPRLADAAPRFIDVAVEMLEAEHADPIAEESRRRAQIDWATATYDWPTRAKEWDACLRALAPSPI